MIRQIDQCLSRARARERVVPTSELVFGLGVLVAARLWAHSDFTDGDVAVGSTH